MKHMLGPLEHADREGVILVSGDGAARLCFPILASYVGDYPEQVLVSLTKSGRCPICPVSREAMGDEDSALPPRNIQLVLDALNEIHNDPAAFHQACEHADIKAVPDAFWRDLPYTNIFELIAPDILH